METAKGKHSLFKSCFLRENRKGEQAKSENAYSETKQKKTRVQQNNNKAHV